MKFYQELPESVMYENKEYKLNLSYRRVLAMFDCLEDEMLSDTVKLKIALNLVVVDEHPNEVGLLIKIIGMLSGDSPKTKEEPVFDIEQDWELIVASFQQAYGIDLTSDKNMHFLRFKALLSGLPSNTKLAAVIKIRTMKVPEANKNNAQEIAELLKYKAIYALKKSNRNNFSSGLGKLFSALKQRVVNRNGT